MMARHGYSAFDNHRTQTNCFYRQSAFGAVPSVQRLKAKNEH